MSYHTYETKSQPSRRPFRHELHDDDYSHGGETSGFSTARDRDRDEKEPYPQRLDPDLHDRTFSTQLPDDDSNRFRAILEEAVERLELLGLVTSDSLRRRKEPSTSRSRKDIASLMIRQSDLEHRYEELMLRRSSLRGLSNKTKYGQTQAEIKEISQALKESTQTITANLKDHPTIVGNLNKIQKDRSQLQNLLISCIDELKYKAFDTLIEQVNQRAEEQRLLAETKVTQEKTSEALKKLEGELESEWDEFERLEEEKNQQISELTSQLKHLKKVTLLTLKYEQQTATARMESVARQRADRLDSLRTSIAKAKADAKMDKRVNKRTLSFLNKQKEQMDQLADYWSNKYNKDYTGKTAELQDLTESREHDQVILIEKQTRWEVDSANKISLIEEAKRREKEEKEKTELLEIMNLAQCKIRFAWRVYWRKRKRVLIKLRKRRIARARAKRKALAAKFPLLMMQKRQADADAKKAARAERSK